MLANFYSSGQICSNGTRVFVHENIKEMFLEKLLLETKKIKAGDPLDPSTHLGPIVSKKQFESVKNFINRAISDGVKVECGEIKDNFIMPYILTNCHDQMECIKEEIFGPVMSILTFNDDYEVIQRANNTHYGLAGAVFTKDISKAHRLASALDVGVCWINAYNLTPVEMPFGGAKHSGIGMENGHEVLKEYCSTQSIYVNHSNEYDSFF